MDLHIVLVTGASELHKVFGPDVLLGVLAAYMDGIQAAFAVAVAFCSEVAFLFSLAVPMKKLPTNVADDAPLVMA
jgi:hypothetical protein